ncbi:MAG: hypothetical protein L0Y58_22495, partial [Verrucomicrobia subdivision 3 bacterium]|nr:hypothetical protein [Limisphaerales bacterium]
MKTLGSAWGMSILGWLLLSLSSNLATGAPSAAAKSNPDRRNVEPFEERWRDAHRQRAFPLEEIPRGARLRALEQIEASKAQAPAEAAFGPFEWFNIGPNPIMVGTVPNSGRVAAIAVDPVDVDHWLIGAAQGGIWETWNAGTTWKARTDNQASLSMGAITFAPSNPQIIYAGTGEANFAYENYAGAGLLKSTNRGTNWFLLAANQFAQSSFSDIRVHQNNANTLVAATVRGVAGRVA